MLPSPSLEESADVADVLRRPQRSLTARERVAEGVLGLGLAAAVAVVWWRSPPGHFAAVPAVVCCLVLVVAARIRIDTPFGFTVPIQLAFVPLVFAMPGALVPIAVVAASMIARVPDLLAGNARAVRLVNSIPNAWYSIGPVAVFAIARVSPDKASAAILVAALAAQCGVDFLAGWLREAIGRGASLGDHLGATWVVVVDVALSIVGLLAAEQIHRTPLAAIAPLPLLALVAVFARERRQRLESLVELNGAYRRARDEAVEASNLKSAFLRNVSHEIRTPMNGVMGMNELLLATDLNDEQRGYAQQVETSAEHMLAVINDILDISKIESGRIDIEPVEFDLRETVEHACAAADIEAQAKGVALEIEVDRRAPAVVRGDRARVRQVLMNLAGNAVKFTAEGSVTAHLAPARGTNRIRFEVADTGIGIDPEMLERMFEPFVQADVSTTRQYGGNGLGLAIAKELVELMGGEIGAHSEPGAGSTFWFELPLPEVADPVPRSRDGARHLRGARADHEAALVLVVEDSPVNRLVAARVLERCGYRAHVVNDGREALQALASQRYDAVLMDCQMPDIDGYEATRELRKRERGADRRTPVIAMTAHAMTGDRAKCLEAGMDDYITKPVRSQTLVEVLERWITTGDPEEAGPGAPTGPEHRTWAGRRLGRARQEPIARR